MNIKRSSGKLIKTFFQNRKFANKSDLFDETESFILFIGYPRSGHSLIGALLDAHPECIVSHEHNVLDHFEKGAKRLKLFSDILKNSRQYARSGREWSGYQYAVPDQWQGRFTKIKVIGDKKGSSTSIKLASNPQLLSDFAEYINTPLKLFHVFRNPFDNVASRVKGGKLNTKTVTEKGFHLAVNNLFLEADINKKIREDKQFEVLDIKHEDFIASPSEGLTRICEFLSLKPHMDYINACESIIVKSPHKTRKEIEFPEDIINIINKRKENYDFLRDYSFDH